MIHQAHPLYSESECELGIHQSGVMSAMTSRPSAQSVTKTKQPRADVGKVKRIVAVKESAIESCQSKQSLRKILHCPLVTQTHTSSDGITSRTTRQSELLIKLCGRHSFTVEQV